MKKTTEKGGTTLNPIMEHLLIIHLWLFKGMKNLGFFVSFGKIVMFPLIRFHHQALINSLKIREYIIFLFKPKEEHFRNEHFGRNYIIKFSWKAQKNKRKTKNCQRKMENVFWYLITHCCLMLAACVLLLCFHPNPCTQKSREGYVLRGNDRWFPFFIFAVESILNASQF